MSKTYPYKMVLSNLDNLILITEDKTTIIDLKNFYEIKFLKFCPSLELLVCGVGNNLILVDSITNKII